ncbi:MAG: peptidoglycan DD-metalloendopeptidase family protein [Anaerolineales bacterium]|nr:peptidoglycan DD-metalloendopeptidase family protein [Anaerolineales bacterium]
MKKITWHSILVILLISLTTSGFAQEVQTDGPIYIVKAGDTLWTIARNLHVPYNELLTENQITSESSILPGTELKVPGLEEITGVLTTIKVSYGESLQSISRRYDVPEEVLIKLNRLTSPMEFYVGVSAVLAGEENPTDQAGRRVALAPEQSSLELAVVENLNPWALVMTNAQEGEWDLIPGEVLFIQGTVSSGPGAFPEQISKAAYSPETFLQGHTSVVNIKGPEGTTIQGSLGEYPLSFFSNTSGNYLALQGLHAKEKLGLKPLSVSGILPDGTPFAHTQMVQIFSGEYPYEEITNVPRETIDVDLTEQETEQLRDIAVQATANKFWKGDFLSPVPDELSTCWLSYYGNRRSYNGSGFFYYHTGLDFCGAMGGSIFAAAPGKVVYNNKLPIHGNTIMLDHGWGIYTLYAHLSEFLVQQGEHVNAGDLLGRVGSTGRSSGPHLHWEVWVGGIQVDPMDWLESSYP